MRSRVPHLLLTDAEQARVDGGGRQAERDDAPPEPQRPGESDEEVRPPISPPFDFVVTNDDAMSFAFPMCGAQFIARGCRSCRGRGDEERWLHCDGIWLHALRYASSCGRWGFTAPPPAWALLPAFDLAGCTGGRSDGAATAAEGASVSSAGSASNSELHI